MARKSKAKLSKTKPIRPPSPEPVAAPSSEEEHVLINDFMEPHEPVFAPQLDDPEPEPELELQLEPEPESPPSLIEPEYATRSAPRQRLRLPPTPLEIDHLAPPSPPPNSSHVRHRRPHSLPNPRLAAPSDFRSRAQTEFGSYPLVAACISCDQCALLTNKRDYNRAKLGLHPSNTDSFIPIVCSACEDDRALFWCRMASANAPPSHRSQYPSTISSKMLRSWSVFADMRARFGVDFDAQERPYKRVTRARDWWREGAISESDAVRLCFWQPVGEADDVAEAMQLVEKRRDLFFGQFVHPAYSV